MASDSYRGQCTIGSTQLDRKNRIDAERDRFVGGEFTPDLVIFRNVNFVSKSQGEALK